jgi:sensor histidine kinase YesM
MPTNTPILPTKPATVKPQLNDIAFRLILIPFFGIAIPLITGLVNKLNFTHWQMKLSFAYTTFIAFLIWEGNRYLLFTLRSYFNWFNKPLRKIAVLMLSVSFYTVPVSALLLVGWYRLFAGGRTNWEVVLTTTLVIMICVVFIVHVYETVFLVKDSENEMLKNAQLEKSRAEAQLEALKNQIDPHFIFNSLNTLSHLIEEKPAKAKQFNDNLADVYRYILQNKVRDLVLLKDEMDFLQDYFSLLIIRFESAVALKILTPAVLFDQYLIPPISLQVLAENAIKHNEFSAGLPIVITIDITEDVLIVSNPIRKKILRKPSSKIGLNNLRERYRLTTGKDITIEEKKNMFTVHLPVLKIT